MGTVTMPDPLRVLGRLFTYEQAAALLQVKPQSLRLWVSQGKLTVIHVGRSVRIPESALHDLAAQGLVRGRNKL
jgi:excisionase family DNA binding protein